MLVIKGYKTVQIKCVKCSENSELSSKNSMQFLELGMVQEKKCVCKEKKQK